MNRVPDMPKVAPRRLLYDDVPNGYLESLDDWYDNNLEAVGWFLENAEAIRAAMKAEEWGELGEVPVKARVCSGIFRVAMQRAFDMGSRHESHILKDRQGDLDTAARIWKDFQQLVESTYKKLNRLEWPQ